MKDKYVVIFSISLLIVVAFSLPCSAQTSNVVLACVQKDTGLTRIVSNPNECGPDETGALRDAVDLQGAVRLGARSIQASNPPVALKIARVIPDITLQTLSIEGMNFGPAPSVSLAAAGGAVVPLTVLGANNEVIQAKLDTVTPGTYLLIVVNGNGNVQQDTMAITLGAVGPKGDQGVQGPAGHTPVLNWSGDQIAIDGSAAGPHLTGPQGPQGPAGHSPVLNWSGDRIAIDGSLTGPQLTGPPGPAGPKGDKGDTASDTKIVDIVSPSFNGTLHVAYLASSNSADFYCPDGYAVYGWGAVPYWANDACQYLNLPLPSFQYRQRWPLDVPHGSKADVTYPKGVEIELNVGAHLCVYGVNSYVTLYCMKVE